MDYLVSVVVPTKNRYKYLKNLIRLIDGFHLDELELVIQDNSDDNTEILEYLKNYSNSNIHYYYSTDKLTMSTNADAGIRNAKGEYVCYIGDDDGTISSSSPVIQGETYAIHNEHTLNFYDGIIKGKTGTVDGTITNEAANSQEVNGTSNGYYTKHLEANNQQQQQSPQQQMQQAPVLQQSEELNETSGDTQVNQTIVDPETNSTSEPNETSGD